MNSDLLWHVSHISGLLGRINYMADNTVGWADDSIQTSKYFCSLHWTDDGECNAVLHADACSDTKLVAAIGYFVYHNIPYVLHD